MDKEKRKTDTEHSSRLNRLHRSHLPNICLSIGVISGHPPEYRSSERGEYPGSGG